MEKNITTYDLEEIRKGNSAVFKRLILKWQGAIHRFAYRFFYDETEADEITQKTFINVYRNLHQLEDPAKFSPWIYRIANNLCLDELKRQGRKMHVSVSEDDESHQLATETPAQILEEKELGEWIQKALMQIPEEQRTVIILKEYEGFTFYEISEITGEPESTIKSRMYYGLKKMREILSKWNINQIYLNHE